VPYFLKSGGFAPVLRRLVGAAGNLIYAMLVFALLGFAAWCLTAGRDHPLVIELLQELSSVWPDPNGPIY
jgi:hypothetical protein